MLRRIAPLGLFVGLVVLVGCGKKDGEDEGGSGSGSGSGGGSGGGAITPADLKDDGPPDSNLYTVKVKMPGVGTPVKSTTIMDMKINMTIPNQGKQDMTMKFDLVARETALKMQPGIKRPLSSRMRFDKFNVSMTPTPPGNDLGLIARKVVNKDLLFTKTGNTYEVLAEDGSRLDPQETIFLQQQYNALYEQVDITDFLPKEPVKRDTPWNAPMKNIAGAASQAGAGVMAFDESKSKATGRLIKVRDQNGRKYGTIVIEATLVTRSSSGGPAEIKPGSKINYTIVSDLCIDGSYFDFNSRVKIDSDMEMSVQGQSVAMKMTGAIQATAVEERSGATSSASRPSPRDDVETDREPTQSSPRPKGAGGSSAPPPPPPPPLPNGKFPETKFPPPGDFDAPKGFGPPGGFDAPKDSGVPRGFEQPKGLNLPDPGPPPSFLPPPAPPKQ